MAATLHQKEGDLCPTELIRAAPLHYLNAVFVAKIAYGTGWEELLFGCYSHTLQYGSVSQEPLTESLGRHSGCCRQFVLVHCFVGFAYLFVCCHNNNFFCGVRRRNATLPIKHYDTGVCHSTGDGSL